MDYNAPLLTLAAMHVMNDTTDPFYTSLEGGVYQPGGHPCNSVYGCSPPPSSVSNNAKIAIAVVVPVVGLAIFGAIFYVFCIRRRRARAKSDPKY